MDIDVIIGENMRLLRGGMLQTELAAKMKDRGHKWSQPTVVAIEKGERPLRLAEAIDVAHLLATDVNLLFAPNSQVAWNDAYMSSYRAEQALAKCLGDFHLSQLGVVAALMPYELDEDEESIQRALKRTPARIFVDYVDGMADSDIVMDVPDGDGYDPTRVERFSRRGRVLYDAWRSDAELIRNESDSEPTTVSPRLTSQGEIPPELLVDFRPGASIDYVDFDSFSTDGDEPTPYN